MTFAFTYNISVSKDIPSGTDVQYRCLHITLLEELKHVHAAGQDTTYIIVKPATNKHIYAIFGYIFS